MFSLCYLLWVLLLLPSLMGEASVLHLCFYILCTFSLFVYRVWCKSISIYLYADNPVSISTRVSFHTSYIFIVIWMENNTVNLLFEITIEVCYKPKNVCWYCYIGRFAALCVNTCLLSQVHVIEIYILELHFPRAVIKKKNIFTSMHTFPNLVFMVYAFTNIFAAISLSTDNNKYSMTKKSMAPRV